MSSIPSREIEFRAEGSNNWLTKAIFLEQSYSDKSNVKYTLKNYDHSGYPSLYKLYMDEADPTEVVFAQKYLGGWAHWKELQECTWFKPIVAQWREELELRMKAQALSTIKRFAVDSESKSCYDANKFLLSGGWKTPQEKRSKVGRPSKEAIKQQAEELFRQSNETESELQRVLKIN